MLRELVHALEALAADAPVVLVLDDLQWVDPSTRDLLAALMRRRHPARVLVVASATGPDPLVTELRLRGTARELALAPLGAHAAAAAFALDPATAAKLTARAGGNPLFMRHLLDQFEATGSLDGVPERCATPSTPASPAFRRPTSSCCGRLRSTGASSPPRRSRPRSGARSRTSPFPASCAPPVRPSGPMARAPRGSPSCTRCTATSLLETVPPAQRVEWHRRIGERLEAGFGVEGEAAPRIAAHHLAGRRPGPALRFLRLAARRCAERGAYREAIGHLRQGLDATAELPDGAARRRARVELLSELGQALVAVEGWSSAEALASLERARAEAEALGDREPLASVLLALATLREVRGQPEHALEAARAGATLAGVEGAELLACALFHEGAFTRALEQADRGVTAFERGARGGHYDTFPATLGNNAGVACHDWAALALYFLGRPLPRISLPLGSFGGCSIRPVSIATAITAITPVPVIPTASISPFSIVSPVTGIDQTTRSPFHLFVQDCKPPASPFPYLLF